MGLSHRTGAAGLSPGEIHELNAAIVQQRQGTFVIEAAPDTEVAVEPMRHHFWFGTAPANPASNGRMRPAARALGIGRRYRGCFAENDLNNERIHGKLYRPALKVVGGRVKLPEGAGWGIRINLAGLKQAARQNSKLPARGWTGNVPLRQLLKLDAWRGD